MRGLLVLVVRAGIFDKDNAVDHDRLLTAETLDHAPAKHFACHLKLPDAFGWFFVHHHRHQGRGIYLRARSAVEDTHVRKCSTRFPPPT